MPPQGDELNSPWLDELKRFLNNPNKPMVLALSRPDKRKNITGLVEAFGQDETLQSLANLVVVAGNRDDIEELDKGAQEVFKELLVAIDRYDLYGKVAMPKHHSRDQVAHFYRVAAALKGVFVNPALTEPFGLTLIEAAASALPVVATEDGGPRDILGNCHNGILVNPLEPQSIGDALKQLLSDKNLWTRSVEQGLLGVREHYSWDAHAKRYLEVVEPIIKRTELLERHPLKRRHSLYRNKAIISDLDQNLLGDPESLERFIADIHRHRKSVKFGIATGRRFDSALKVMRRHGIPEPDILITSGGTEIYYAPKLTADIVWRKHIDYQWTPSIVREVLDELPGMKRQPKEEQSLYKVSYYIDPEQAPDLEEINSLLHQRGLAVNTSLAFGQFLDVLPIRASKGLALRYVADRWHIPLQNIFVAGGSGADEDMMRGNTLAAVVGNRHNEELSQLMDVENIYFAEHAYAAGILEAIEHYHFFDEDNSDGETQP
jgi:sucrose-phosphate synthase